MQGLRKKFLNALTLQDLTLNMFIVGMGGTLANLKG